MLTSSDSASSPEPGSPADASGSTYAGYGGYGGGGAQYQQASPSSSQHTAYLTSPTSTAMGKTSGSQPARSLRDRQARGKDPYQSEMQPGRAKVREPRKPTDSYELKERRAYATSVLQSKELLMQWAHHNGDSIAGARLKFTRVMCGFENETIAKDSDRDRRIAKRRSMRNH